MELFIILKKSFIESINISLIIFVLMILIEVFVLKLKNKFIGFLKKKNVEVIVSSLFGIIPGCVGTFAIDSLYMAGLIGFGGIIAVMVATSGDEAFLLLSLALKNKAFAPKVFLLFFVLFILGIISGLIANKLNKKNKLKLHCKCEIKVHKKEFNFKHFIKKHIFKHIIKKHMFNIFLWLFITLIFVNSINLSSLELINNNMLLVLFISALIGIVPVSGPNMLLMILFVKGVVPFSVVLTNSIIQDGHGLLPIMGFSIKDAFKIKLFNLIFGLIVGLILFFIGL